MHCCAFDRCNRFAKALLYTLTDIVAVSVDKCGAVIKIGRREPLPTRPTLYTGHNNVHIDSCNKRAYLLLSRYRETMCQKFTYSISLSSSIKEWWSARERTDFDEALLHLRLSQPRSSVVRWDKWPSEVVLYKVAVREKQNVVWLQTVQQP